MESFFSWWQHLPSSISPVFFHIGSIEVRFYGLCFLGALAISYAVSRWRLKRESLPYSTQHLDDYYAWVLFGVVLGGRFGYVLFYNLPYYLLNPLEIIFPFDIRTGRFVGISGMSFHGGLLGALLVTFLVAKYQKHHFLSFLDFLMPSIPAGYTLGRLGNFFNGELYGRVTDVPWGMFFPLDPQRLLRHPSQLYEALGEGVLIFVLLWTLRKRKIVAGGLFSIYLMAYGVVRFAIEFTREPDMHIGLLWGVLSLGQLLCLAMIVFGFLIFFCLSRKEQARI